MFCGSAASGICSVSCLAHLQVQDQAKVNRNARHYARWPEKAPDAPQVGH